VPPPLRGKRLVEVSVSALLAGASFSGDLEGRLDGLFEALRSRPDVILFIDEIHSLVAAGRSSGAGMAVRAREAFYRFRGRQAAILAVSEATRRRLQEIGLPEKNLHLVRNGVDLARFSPVPPPGLEPLRLVYPSRILPGKAQHLAIDAVGRLRPEQRRRVRLSIVGAVADQIYADRLRLQSFKQPVDFAFDVPDIVPYYQSADVVLFPTLMEEGFGYTAIEAMACARPVIWSEQPAIREATGGIGLAVPPDDADALRHAIWKLVENPELRLQIGQEGRRFVEAHYAWDSVWQRYEEIFAQLRGR
jgi:glycosyltransferase involved in cell wall biosynthesis